MHERAVEHLEIEDDLRRAIDAGNITVEYQPTIALDSGRVVGVEALARWNHPTRGAVPPSVFIPIAERSGLIGRLGLQVLDTACRTANLLHEVDPTLDLNVNLSPHQLADPGLATAVARVLDETGLDPQRLVLEITENALMDDVDITTGRLRELKALGIRLAIDDFGTGYSSLSYLRHFPVDVLKIDRSFVETLPGAGSELARTILRLGQTLHLEVVAEGIETPPQLAELSQLGCNQGQGFLFARPLPVDEVQKLIAAAAADGLRWQDALADQR
jgi:EAL domain-containing protein (putative c-di-GMP-specific phosphodiesterase class I)